MCKKRIFIVDDSVTNLLLLNDILIDEGYIIDTFVCPADALSRIRTLTPDLILLDLHMPGLNGFQFYEKIKNRNIPVIIVSANVNPTIIDRAFALGVMDYITKPIQIKCVLEKVNQILYKADDMIN